MLLEQLLGDIPPAQFLSQYYLRLPFSRPGGCAAMTAGADWEAIDRLLAHPRADVIVGREGTRWPGKTPASAAEAKQVLAAGFMFGIRHADRIDDRLAELASQFREQFAAPIDIHLYCTPAGHPGFGWHYDAEEVFVLQMSGSKDWYLRKNTVHPWPLIETLPADMKYQREIMPIVGCKLAAGDWLYIPSGYWHRTQAAAGEESISLSVGVLAPSALELLEYLRPHLRHSLLWRQRLPALATGEQTQSEVQAHFAALGRDFARLLADGELMNAFLAELREPPPAADNHV